MLKLVDIKKAYGDKDFIVPALKGISLEFRKSEFVSILGPSGCGKTTLLNIIGGLDKYTSGDLIINGRSTKDYQDKNWDAYRNRTIGFVFQDYNLIPHLTVVENVELALTLSGEKKAVRRERAVKALELVGLSEHIKKKPNQLSGGQKQRVAIARAIINNPDVILADEPTGALDSKTSIQIMEILKEISKDRLVIMVTHNNDLAEQYSTRIISLLDGVVTNDTNPYTESNEAVEDKLATAKTSMSIFTAFGLSLKNLLTKKTRTILTALGSSIGIIGIALILSLSNGFNIYINNMQRDTLSTLPISISSTALGDLSNIEIDTSSPEISDDVIISYVPSTSIIHRNNITEEYVDYLEARPDLYSFISYRYNMDFNIAKEQNGSYSYLRNISIFQLASNETMLTNEYPLLEDCGRYPENANEIVLVLNNDRQISETVLTELGLSKGTGSGEAYEFSDFVGKTFKVILNNEAYSKDLDTNIYSKNTLNSSIYNNENAVTLEIVGVVYNNSTSSQFDMSSILGGASDYEGIGYTSALAEYIHTQNYESNIAVDQRADMTTNVLTGESYGPLGTQTALSNLQKLGGYALPTSIYIYVNDFEQKTDLKAYLDAYNLNLSTENQIVYTDSSEMISETLSTMIDAISIVLIIFAAISLVVSSIMIGIITYVSVIERTKEIGVLRSIGARKRDISRVFNAETLLIGFGSGVLGILISLILLIPINLIVSALAMGVDISAVLNPLHALFLIALSTILTVIAGLIPASIASKKQPVLCLRAE